MGYSFRAVVDVADGRSVTAGRLLDRGQRLSVGWNGRNIVLAIALSDIWIINIGRLLNAAVASEILIRIDGINVGVWNVLNVLHTLLPFTLE